MVAHWARDPIKQYNRISCSCYAAVAILVLVNVVEQPFARSLIVCTEPAETAVGAPFSGSARCGDRLRVIGEGATLSGKGQSLEQLSRFFAMLVMSSVADIFGRKVAILIGLFSVFISTILFVLASVNPTYAYSLFILAQGIQGAHGLEILGLVICGDFARETGDTTTWYAKREQYSLVTSFLFWCLGMYIQSLDLTDYTLVWTVLSLGTLLILLDIVAFFPETMPISDKNMLPRSVIQTIGDEVRGYHELIMGSKWVASTVFESAFVAAGEGVFPFMVPFMMAYFGYSPMGAIFGLVPSLVVGALCVQLTTKLCHRFGHRNAWEMLFAYNLAKQYLLWPFMCTRAFGLVPIPIVFAYLSCLSSGMNALRNSVILKIVGIENNVKFTALVGIVKQLVGSASTYLYAEIFDATTTNYMSKLNIISLSNLFWTLVFIIFFSLGIRARVHIECDKLTAEENAKSHTTTATGTAEGLKKD